MVNIFENRKIEGESAVTNSVKNVIEQAQISHEDFSVNDEIFEEVIVLKKDQPTKGKTIRVYRGLVKCDRSILEQLPYALRKIVDYGDQPNAEKLEELKAEVSFLANNLSYENFLKNIEKVRPLLHADEVKHLNDDLKKIESRVLKGNSISEIITQLQFLHARGSSRSGVSPFVSASTNPHEAAGYGNMIAVLDVPVAMVSQIAGPRHGEVMLRGVIPQEYITAYLTKYDRPFSKDEKLYNGVDKALAVLAEHDKTPIFSEKESLALRKKQFTEDKAKRKEQYEKDLKFIMELQINREKVIEVGNLADFDQEYFQSLEGKDGWIALGHDEYKNQRYFTGLSATGEKVGIVGVYDVGKEQHVLHYVVDQKYRGQGLARELADQIMEKLNLPQVILTIDLDNKASIRAAEKMPGVEKVSNSAYEKDYHKVKYIYRKPDKKV